MNLQEIRSQYPQYNDMSDGQLADAFHSKFYSDMDRGEFNKAIGYKPKGFNHEAEAKRTGGRVFRNLSAAGASMIDLGLLAPKTIASGVEVGAEALGFEGSPVEKFAEKIRTTPPLRDQVLAGIDSVTNDTLKPRGLMDKTFDFASEIAVPSTILGKTQMAARKAPTILDAVKTALNPVQTLDDYATTLAPKTVQGGGLVRLSKGEITQDFADQELEELARKGILGEGALKKADIFDVQRQQDLAEASTGILGRNVSGNVYDSVQDAADIATKQRAKLKLFVDKAYAKAREAGKGVQFDSKLVKEGMYDNLIEDLSAQGLKPNAKRAPIADDILQELKTATKGTKTVKLEALEGWRTNATAQANSRALSGTPEGTSLKAMVKGYDNFMQELADAAISEGDDVAISAFKKARGLRARLGKLYEQNKIVDDVTTGAIETPEQLVQKLIGAGKLNGNKVSGNTAKQLIKASRGKSEETRQSLQDALLSRMLTRSKGDALIPGTETKAVSFKKLETNLGDLLDDNATLAKEVFGDEKIKTLRQLQRDLTRMNKRPGIVNNSNSANIFLRAMQGAGGFAKRHLPLVGTVDDFVVKPMSGASSAQKAGAAFDEPQKIIAKLEADLAKSSRAPVMSSIFGGTLATAATNQQ